MHLMWFMHEFNVTSLLQETKKHLNG